MRFLSSADLRNHLSITSDQRRECRHELMIHDFTRLRKLGIESCDNRCGGPNARQDKIRLSCLKNSHDWGYNVILHDAIARTTSFRLSRRRSPSFRKQSTVDDKLRMKAAGMRPYNTTRQSKLCSGTIRSARGWDGQTTGGFAYSASSTYMA